MPLPLTMARSVRRTVSGSLPRAFASAVPEWRDRQFHRFRRAFNTKPEVAHHGIQRSGTNFLRARLEQAGFFVVNAVDPGRDDPRHKHFRWQAEKATIRMDLRYWNQVVVESLDEIDRHAGYPAGVNHVVIVKSPAIWLDSIRRWGLACRWFSEHDDFWGAADLAPAYMVEWSAYYEHWLCMHEKAPSRVHLVCFDDLVLDHGPMLASLTGALGRDCGDPRAISPLTKVAHSSARSGERQLPAPSHEALEVAERLAGCEWRRFCR